MLSKTREYQVKADIQTTFNYFKSWDYLRRSFKNGKREEIIIKSKNGFEELGESDEVVLVLKYKNTELTISYFDIKIEPLKSIELKLKYGVKGKQSVNNENNNQKEEKNYEPKSPIHLIRIIFEEQPSYVNIVETNDIKGGGSMFNFFYGVVNRFKKESEKEEIENLINEIESKK